MINKRDEYLNLRGIQHIIWDWNGTLLNDIDLVVEITGRMLQKRGRRPIDRIQYQRMFGFPVADFYKKMGFSFDEEPYDALVTEFTTEYERRCLDCQLHAGAREILSLLQDEGISHSILSATKQSFLEETVSFFGIASHFNEMAGLDNKRAGGKLEAGRELMDRLDLPADSILIVGDTLHDYEVARDLGVRCLIIPNGYNAPERFSACPSPMVASIMEIASLAP